MRHCVEMKKNNSYAAYIKCMAKIQEQNIMPEVKLYKPRKPRAKETSPRRQEEAEFRREVIKLLKKKGCVVKRLENGIGGNLGNGIPDLLIFFPCDDYFPWYTKKIIFIELKSSQGKLDGGSKEGLQREFQELCIASGVKHLVLKAGEDVWERIKSA